jgi:hypothetical protein
MPGWMVQHVASSASAHGIDVDASSPFSTWLATYGAPQTPQIETRSLWLPMDATRSQRHLRLIEATMARQPDLPPQLVLLVPNTFTLRDITRAIDTMRPSTSNCLVSFGLPSSLLRGGRPHLVQLGTIRRLAEEWDVGVAVDLSGRFDPTWEAEAAIARLGNRLKLLRLSAGAPSRTAVGRDRVACRALHAAIDRAGMFDVALTSPRPIPFPMTPRAAANAAQRAAAYVVDRAAYQAEVLREGIDRFEGSRSPRGG